MTNPAGESLGFPVSAVGASGDDGLVPVNGQHRRAGSWRGLFEWSATAAPVGLLLTAGLAFGPQGVNLLSPSVLGLLNPVVAVALAALGVLVGLSVGDRRSHGLRALAVALLHPAVTVVLVSAGIAAVGFVATSSIGQPLPALVLAAGICAATSLTLPTGNPLEPRTAATRIREFGVLLPIVAGGLMLAWVRTGSPTGAGVLAAQASGVTLALAAAGWLLLTRATSETEERVFAVSALLLVGGVADVLSLSALLGGLVAGVFWRYAGHHPRETISRDVLFVQRPFVVLVLLVAGARTDVSVASLGLGAAYLALRTAGQLAGGIVVRRVAGAAVPPDLGRHLLPPGMFGVAFALNTAGVLGADASVLLAAVVFGTIGSEIVAVLLPPRRAGE